MGLSHGDCERCFANRRCDGVCAEMARATEEMLTVFAERSEACRASTAPCSGVPGGDTAR